MSIIKKMHRKLKERARVKRAIAELNSLSDRSLLDIGISRDEIPYYVSKK